MRIYQDLSFKEISDLTNVGINTALGRMRYALINLRKIIKENNLHETLCDEIIFKEKYSKTTSIIDLFSNSIKEVSEKLDELDVYSDDNYFFLFDRQQQILELLNSNSTEENGISKYFQEK